MNKIWYTRDNDGQRALWNDVPVKIDGVWWTNENRRGNYKLMSADWNGDDESIDSIIGEGFQGLRKGQIAELVITWSRMA